MSRGVHLTLLVLVVLMVSGCYTTGLSLRENSITNYSNFVYGLYNGEEQKEGVLAPLQKPIRLAVAQVGENAPPQAMLDKLEKERALISKVASIPASGQQINFYNENREVDLKGFEQRMTKMRKLAKDLGTDYLFLFGGSAEYGATSNLLTFFDISFVGGYILPSNKIQAEGRAVGALIDIETGRVVYMVSSEAKKRGMAATFMVYEKQQDVIVDLRDALVSGLADNFIMKLRSQG